MCFRLNEVHETFSSSFWSVLARPFFLLIIIMATYENTKICHTNFHRIGRKKKRQNDPRTARTKRNSPSSHIISFTFYRSQCASIAIVWLEPYRSFMPSFHCVCVRVWQCDDLYTCVQWPLELI